MRPRSLLLTLTLTVTLAFAGCLDVDRPVTTVPPDEAFEERTPGARADGAFDGETRRERVVWENGDSRYAIVNVTLKLTQGSITVRILDANGLPVFEEEFTGENEGTITSRQGLPGRWAVTLDANNAKGDWAVDARPY